MTARPKPPATERRAQPQVTYVMQPGNSDSLAVLSTKVDTLVRQTNDTNDTLRSLTRAVTQLAVIEERQTADRQAVDRAFAEIKSTQVVVDKLEHGTDSRLKALEAKAPMNDLSNGLLIKAGWLVISAVIGAVMVVVLGKPPAQSPVFIQQAPAANAAPAIKPAR